MPQHGPPLLADRTPLHTYVDGETAAAVDREARRRGLSRSAYLRTVVIERLVERSRTEQGLPPRVTDPAALDQVAGIIGTTSELGHADGT